MHPGPLEIILIIVIIIIVAVLARIFRGRYIARQGQGSPEDTGAPGVRATGPRRIFRRTGIAGIIVGVILLLASISMFRWAFHSYLWAFVIIAIGFVIVFLTRQKG